MAVSLVLVVAAALLYLGARETPVFAVRTIDVEGVRPSVARRVEMALRPLEGKSLLKVRSGEVERLATALPSIASVTYDRAFPNTQGGWDADCGAVFDLTSNNLRPIYWTSADAAGLPIFPGLARWDEAKRGVIDHALRFTAARTRRAFVYPARHYASSSNDPSLPPMGLRVRLKASFDVRPFPRQARIVLVALKRYGMLLADNGSNWYISGAPSPGWSNDQLHTLGRVTGSNFEVVDASSLRPR